MVSSTLSSTSSSSVSWARTATPAVRVRVTPMRTEIVIRATRTQNVLGEKGRRIRELTSWVQKRFNFPEGNVELYAERYTPCTPRIPRACAPPPCTPTSPPNSVC